jgi:hypothetical protein
VALQPHFYNTENFNMWLDPQTGSFRARAQYSPSCRATATPVKPQPPPRKRSIYGLLWDQYSPAAAIPSNLVRPGCLKTWWLSQCSHARPTPCNNRFIQTKQLYLTNRFQLKSQSKPQFRLPPRLVRFVGSIRDYVLQSRCNAFLLLGA